jgi:hypothetical protein
MNSGLDQEDSDRAWEEKLMAMASQLPREREPGRLLEERTIATLRMRGLLRTPRRLRLTPAWLAGAVAASVALFASGVAFGQWLGSRNTANAVLALSQKDALLAAAQVQRAGTQYVNALQMLAQFADSTNTMPAQGREVALSALYAAANEVVRFAPNDPMATEILRGFQRMRAQQLAQPEHQPARQIVWF